MDFLDDEAPAKLMEALGDKPDLVISDMAAPTTGHRRTDHLRTVHLCEVAADFAVSVLKPGGHFLTKTFQGGTENELLAMLKQKFKSVHHIKPLHRVLNPSSFICSHVTSKANNNYQGGFQSRLFIAIRQTCIFQDRSVIALTLKLCRA